MDIVIMAETLRGGRGKGKKVFVRLSFMALFVERKGLPK